MTYEPCLQIVFLQKNFTKECIFPQGDDAIPHTVGLFIYCIYINRKNTKSLRRFSSSSFPLEVNFCHRLSSDPTSVAQPGLLLDASVFRVEVRVGQQLLNCAELQNFPDLINRVNCVKILVSELVS